MLKSHIPKETAALDLNDLHTGLIKGRRAAGLSASVGHHLLHETSQAQAAVHAALAANARVHHASGRQVKELGLPRMDFGQGGQAERRHRSRLLRRCLRSFNRERHPIVWTAALALTAIYALSRGGTDERTTVLVLLLADVASRLHGPVVWANIDALSPLLDAALLIFLGLQAMKSIDGGRCTPVPLNHVLCSRLVRTRLVRNPLCAATSGRLGCGVN